MRTAPLDRLGDLVAIVAAAMPAEDRDSSLEEAMEAAVDDVNSAEPVDVVCAVVGLVGVLLGEIAALTGESRDDVLRRVALDIATNMPRGTDEVST
jgi:hypothetical protein